MVLPLAVEMKRALITHWCFSYCQILLRQHRGLFCLSPMRRLEAKERLRGGTAGSNWPRRNSTVCNIMLCNKSCGEARRRGDVQRILCVFPNHCEVCLGIANTSCPWEVGNEFCFVLLPHSFLLYLLSCCYLNTRVFTFFTFSPVWLFPPSPCGKVSCGTVLSCLPRLKYSLSQRQGQFGVRNQWILCKCTTVLTQFPCLSCRILWTS